MSHCIFDYHANGYICTRCGKVVSEIIASQCVESKSQTKQVRDTKASPLSSSDSSKKPPKKCGCTKNKEDSLPNLLKKIQQSKNYRAQPPNN